VPDTLKLYQAKFVKGARILWELAIAFSPRLSEAADKRINEEESKEEFAVRGGRMYTEIIRVWDIVFQTHKQVIIGVTMMIENYDDEEEDG
jgi:hypothetical protein